MPENLTNAREERLQHNAPASKEVISSDEKKSSESAHSSGVKKKKKERRHVHKASAKPLKSILKTSDESSTSDSASAGSGSGSVSSVSMSSVNSRRGLEDPSSNATEGSKGCPKSSPKSSPKDNKHQWRMAHLKMTAIGHFRKHMKGSPDADTSKYSISEVGKLLKEMEYDIKDMVDDNADHVVENANALEQLDSKADRDPRGQTPEQTSLKTSTSGLHGKALFKAAANAIMFMGKTKKKVRFTNKSVRQFARSSSFWDHEYWDEEDGKLSANSSIMSSSHDSSSFSLGKESWMAEWESRVTLMPTEEELRRACRELVSHWVQAGLFPSKSAKWARKFGGLSPVDVIYHRIQRHPAVALRKLSELCNRPLTYFIDAEDRQDVAMLYLYEALARWDREGDSFLCISNMNGDMNDSFGSLRSEEEPDTPRRKGWNSFVSKVEVEFKKVMSFVIKSPPKQ